MKSQRWSSRKIKSRAPKKKIQSKNDPDSLHSVGDDIFEASLKQKRLIDYMLISTHFCIDKLQAARNHLEAGTPDKQAVNENLREAMNALDESRNLNTSNFGDSYVARKLDQIDNEIDETRSVVAHL